MKASIDYERNQLTRYQILMQRRQHIERIFWSRIQVLHLIQAGVLVGSFYLQSKDPVIFSPALLFVGIVLTVILFILCKNDWEDASRNDRSMHNLGDSLGIRRTAERWYIPIPKIPRRITIKSHILLYFVVILFILVDLTVLFCFRFYYWGIASAIMLFLLLLVWLFGSRWGIVKKES